MTIGPILKTKFYIPHFREEYISRPQIIRLLNTGVKRSLVLIAAPAGYGKSTIMAEWVAQTQLPVAWLSLDRTHNDLITFLQYLIASLQTKFPTLGSGLLNSITYSSPPPIQSLAIEILNEIINNRQEFVLILDDFHHIQNSDVIDLVSTLINNLPPQFHMIIASRSELPFSVARLLSQGELTSLGVEELRFSSAEISLFLSSRLGGKISPNEEQIIRERSEGWITGLQMAVLSIESGNGLTAQPETFSGENRYVTDYLMDEVLARKSPEIYQFLLKTSLLDKLSASLCNGLTGFQNSQEILEELDRSGMFVIPLDATRTWYRYHHLFADLLNCRFRTQFPGQVESTHRRAAAWYFDHNFVEEAVEHSLQAKDYETVIQYLNSIADDMLAKGRFSLYLGWLDRIPDQYFANSPKLILYRVFQLWEMGDLEKYQQQIEFAERLLGPTPDISNDLDVNTATYHGILAVIKGVKYCGDYNTKQGSICFQRALSLLPENQVFWRVLSLGATGFCYRVEGNYSEASACFRQVMTLGPRSNLIFITFMYSIAQALVLLTTGKLNEAIECIKTPLGLDEKFGFNIPYAGLAYSVMGELAFQTGNLPLAEERSKRGIDLITRDGDAYSLAKCSFTLAKVYMAQGKTQAALLTMDQLFEKMDLLQPAKSAFVIARAYQANIYIDCKETELVNQWAANTGSHELIEDDFPEILGLSYFGIYCTIHEPLRQFKEFIDLTLIRHDLANGSSQNALIKIDELFSRISQPDRIALISQLRIYKALALQKIGAEDQAVEELIQVLQLVAPEPFYEFFVHEGQPMLTLLEKCKHAFCQTEGKNGESAVLFHFINEVIEKFPSVDSPQPQGTPGFDLTPREMDVLTQVAEGFSYEETAKILSLSLNTVKTHLKRVYSKLEVENRLQAVIKAKKIGLLN